MQKRPKVFGRQSAGGKRRPLNHIQAAAQGAAKETPTPDHKMLAGHPGHEPIPNRTETEESNHDDPNPKPAGRAHRRPRGRPRRPAKPAGLRAFLDYAREAGALGADEQAGLLEAGRGVRKGLIAAQADLQANQDEVLQFLGFLKSSLNAGLCHFSGSLKQGAPAEHPSFWGWRVIPGPGDAPPSIDKPLGELVGWVDPVRVYLDGT
jgi:hypothetical protein